MIAIIKLISNQYDDILFLDAIIKLISNQYDDILFNVFGY